MLLNQIWMFGIRNKLTNYKSIPANIYRNNIIGSTIIYSNTFYTSTHFKERNKSKVSYSSLLKHKRPDGLSGNERRRKLIKEQKSKRYVTKPISSRTRGFIPTKFQLNSLPSDVKKVKTNITYETLSARKKFKERQINRNSKSKVKTTMAKQVTKFDMVDIDTLDALEKKVKDTTFNDLGLQDSLLDSVYKLFPDIPKDSLKPTEIQALAIPELLKNNHQHVLMAAETGSGKTLAYLLPIISKLKEEEKSTKVNKFNQINKNRTNNADFGLDENDPFKNGIISNLSGEESNNSILNQPELRLLSTTESRQLNRPRAIVLVPSCALAEQVHAVAKKISHLVKFRTTLLTRSTVRKDFLRRLTMPIDLIVTTPASFNRYLKDNILSLSHITQVAIDEADTMFEKGFEKEVVQTIKNIQKNNNKQNKKYQIQIVSATLPKLILQSLDKLFNNNIIRITTPSLHKALPQCKQHFIDLKNYQGNRQLALLDVLRQFDQRSSISNQQKLKDRIIIFCNTRKSVSIIQTFLKEKNINSISLYGGIPFPNTPPATDQQVKQFVYPNIDSNYDFNNPSRNVDDKHDKHDKHDKENSKILICTDIASRGLDTTAVNHVILYDFPTSSIDFLHRSGRTARAGKFGIVTALVGKKDRSLADRIKRAIKTNKVLN